MGGCQPYLCIENGFAQLSQTKSNILKPQNTNSFHNVTKLSAQQLYKKGLSDQDLHIKSI